jgi:ribosome-associated protein
MKPIAIKTEPIELGQFLKLAGVVDTGGQAKALLAEGAVRVNGEPEARRGRKLHAGDTVEVAGYGAYTVEVVKP